MKQYWIQCGAGGDNPVLLHSQKVILMKNQLS